MELVEANFALELFCSLLILQSDCRDYELFNFKMNYSDVNKVLILYKFRA